MLDPKLEFILNYCCTLKIVRVFFVYLLNVIPGNLEENIHVLYNQIEHGVDVQKWTSFWWLSCSKFGMYSTKRCWKIGFYQRRINVLLGRKMGNNNPK